MLKYHLVVNTCSRDWKKQMREQAGFAEQFFSGSGAVIEACWGETYFIEGENYTPEATLKKLEPVINPEDLYIFGNDEGSAGLAVRIAARSNGSSVTEVHGVSESSADLEYGLAVQKMMYANHMEAVFAMKQGPYCISLAKGVKQKQVTEDELPQGQTLVCESADYIISQEFVPQKEQGGLDEAKIIVAAGRGVGKKENMKVLEQAAENLGGEIAVSRPAAMNAWEPMEYLLGVSGAMVQPHICITAGISGAAAFYTGIEKSQFIVAINKDEHAPIMKMADVAVVDDFLPVVEELNRLTAK